MNKQELLDHMALSALAYQDRQPLLPGETLRVIDDPNTGVQCYIREKEGVLTIVFRGTDSAQDWHTDFMFWKRTVPYGNVSSKIRVHAGFIGAYKNPFVRGQLHGFITPQVRLVRVAGHSYGAALALLCGVDLQYNFPQRDFEVMVFGGPRVGNRAFRDSYNKRVFKTLRVEYGNDIVTKVPFALLGYHHVGIPIRLGPPRLPFVVSFLNHRPQEYYRGLFAQLGN